MHITISGRFVKVIADVKLIYPDKDIAVLIEDATAVAWEMLTLIPPPVLCSPEKFSEKYQQVVGNTEGIGRYYRLSYYTPVMLYSAHGTVAVRGIVCKEASEECTVNENSVTESEGK